MNYKIEVTTKFSKQAVQLHKKYPSLKKDISDLVESLYENPQQGLRSVKVVIK